MSENIQQTEPEYLVIKENPDREYVWVNIYEAGYLFTHPRVVTYLGGIAHDANGFRSTTPKEEQEISIIGDGLRDS